MRVRHPLAILVAAAALAGPGCGENEEALPTQPADGLATKGLQPVFGVSEPVAWRTTPPIATPDQIAAATRRLGAQAHRFLVDWRVAEPDPPTPAGVHRYDFEQFDVMYQADLRAGVRPLIVIMNAPAWAAPAGAELGARSNNPPSPEYLDDWSAFAAAIAKRYPRALAIEVWNEPNIAAFWGTGTPDPAFYAELLAAASEAINSQNPAMPVVGGALAGATETTANGMAAGEFADGMLRAGAAAHIDALSVHPYPRGPDLERFDIGMEAARVALEGAGADAPIWITEVGASTTGPDGVTLERQNGLLDEIYTAAFASDDVGAVFVHNLFPSSPNRASGEPGFALLDPAGAATPAFESLRQLERTRVAGAPEGP